MLPQIDTKSKILTDLKLNRSKCVMLSKNVVAPCMLNSLIEDIENSAYSLIIDGSTDIAYDR